MDKMTDKERKVMEKELMLMLLKDALGREQKYLDASIQSVKNIESSIKLHERELEELVNE